MTFPFRSTVIRVLATAAYRSGAVHGFSILARYFALAGRECSGFHRRPPAFQILKYHRVNDDRDPFFPSLPIEVFRQQMAYVARNYCVLTVEEIIERIGMGGLPRNAIAITFDDGYQDTLTHAAPILCRYRIPATVFLATGFIGVGECLWFDRLALAFKLTRERGVRLPDGQVMPLSTQPERLRALDMALAHLKRIPDDKRREGVASLLDQLAVRDPQPFKELMLSWDDVNALAKLGFSIGAHSVSHPILSRVTCDQLEKEILGSKIVIETLLGRPVKTFAYPNGGEDDYTDTVKRLVREAGFTCSVTTRHGVNTSDDDRFELKRGGPWEHHLPTFALKLAWYRLSLS